MGQCIWLLRLGIRDVLRRLRLLGVSTGTSSTAHSTTSILGCGLLGLLGLLGSSLLWDAGIGNVVTASLAGLLKLLRFDLESFEHLLLVILVILSLALLSLLNAILTTFLPVPFLVGCAGG